MGIFYRHINFIIIFRMLVNEFKAPSKECLQLFIRVLIVLIALMVIVLSCVAYYETKQRTTDVCIEISAETLAKNIGEDPLLINDLLSNYYLIDGFVDDVINFQGETVVLLNGGPYNQIYVRKCVREKGSRTKVRCKLDSYTGAIFATAK